MPSPYVRRRQLAAEIRKLRESRGLTADGLASLMFYNRAKISRLENAQRRPDLAEIMNILDVLEVTGSQYDRLLKLAREAAQKGWWDRYGMTVGSRQKIAADLEYNAAVVRSYDQTAMPGALQCRPFIEALIKLDENQMSPDLQPERMVEARERRHQELLRPDGPVYETILDECVIHRLALHPEVIATQLRSMIKTVTERDTITVRVLLHNARIPGGLPPQSSFYLYSFAEPGDPPIAVIDTVTADLILTQPKELARYNVMYDRLRDAALSPEDSIAFLGRVANRVTGQAGSET
ncbi:helix-turn-helix domain-containing protein [Actinomadura bangladeshensis]|uniref:XRE family transcriptional regulator n=1 Tax=Actinomadura bangladeshensis TaxID=453573 RepID=A0A4R4N9Y8_9ACTN|nr:helix-turn-helix transcriptional regulator [Actinomadura bangladeshensis]TDC05821.1 XRE family transcriptional regulator [Actinomadura bangladeshensis]